MAIPLVRASARAVPITPVPESEFRSWLAKQSAALKSWVKASGFKAKPQEICLVPRGRGIARVLVGIGEDDGHWAFAGLPSKLPPGTYRLDAAAPGAESYAAPLALGWALGSYEFSRYKKPGGGFASLVWPEGADREAVTRAAEAVFLVRDLINTPALDMGPAELAAAARELARKHKAKVSVVTGDALRARNFPLVHAVGRASARERAPRLIDLRWGRPGALKLTLVGKGVCFDTGGLNLKNEKAMQWMKKDMGGAAHVLGLAGMIMSADLDVSLRVLIPAVENSVSAESMRPLDVVKSRHGLTVEIGNTDAEGRLVLADALAEASRGEPDLLIDVATLTGAARAALGPEVPALFSNDDALATDLLHHAARESDPMWRLPLWKPYRSTMESQIADISSTGDMPYAGAITAALFLSEFVAPGIPWAHLDIMAWNVTAKPGRPKGGEAMGLRALYALVAERAARAAKKPRRKAGPKRRALPKRRKRG